MSYTLESSDCICLPVYHSILDSTYIRICFYVCRTETVGQGEAYFDFNVLFNLV